MSKLEEDSISKTIWDDKRIEDLVTNIYEKIPQGFFPLNYLNSGIEELLKSVNKRENYLNKMLILEAKYTKKVSPYKISLKNNKYFLYYGIHVFDKFYGLGKFENEKTEEVEVEIKIKRGNIRFKFIKDGEEFSKSRDSFFYCKKLNKKLSENLIAVGIKKTSSQGELTMGRRLYNFGTENKNKEVIVLFNQKKAEFFDTSGNPLVSALSVAETFEKKRLVKAYDLVSQMEKIDMSEYYNKVVLKAQSEWLANPLSFLKFGRNYIIQGTTKTATYSDGAIRLSLYQNNKKCISIRISRTMPLEEAQLFFKGPFLVVYDKEGQLVNAKQFDYPYYKNLHYCDKDLETILVKTFSMKSRLTITVGKFSYTLSEKDARKKLGRSIREFDNFGMLVHKLPGEEPTFELLLKDRDSFTKIPALVTSKKKID
ncbi:MAG: hypothetical protein QXG86_03195 [Candidatus Woesearchaeota archaeon]